VSEELQPWNPPPRPRTRWIGHVSVGFERYEPESRQVVISSFCEDCEVKIEQGTRGQQEWVGDHLVRRLVTERCGRPGNCPTGELLFGVERPR
jgi:hypothetical protein